MSSSFPTSLDLLSELTGQESMATHSSLHNNERDAIDNLEAKVGVNSSAVTSSLDYKINHLTAGSLTDITASAAELNVLDGIPATLTATELGYVDGVTSAIQTQIGNKIETSYLDTDGTLAANSDSKIATQKAVKTYVTANASPADGWIAATGTWTYASSTTITVPSGAAALYQKGDRLKITQTTVKFLIVAAVADTLLTVTGGSDYTVANAAITSPYYSHQSSPIGFPTWFAFSPTWTGFSADPSSVCRFEVIGTTVHAFYHVYSDGTSNATTMTATLPITARTLTNGMWSSRGRGKDNGALLPDAFGYISSADTVVNFQKTPSGTSFTSSGAKGVYEFIISYEM